MRTWLAGAAITALVIGCAAPSLDSTGAEGPPSSNPAPTDVSTTVIVGTTTIAPSTTTTTETPTTTTTTVARDPENLSSWSGVEFSVETSDPSVEGAEILANVENYDVEFLIGSEPAGIHGWYVGGTGFAFGVPDLTVVVVADEDNSYAPSEFEMYELGVEAIDPDPSVSHILTVWAIEEIDSTRYVITDAMDIELPAPLLGYGALTTVTQEPWTCEVDQTLQTYMEPDKAGNYRTAVLYAFFDLTSFEKLEIEKPYPPVLAFTNTDGALETVSPDLVRCILRFDPDEY